MADNSRSLNKIHPLHSPLMPDAGFKASLLPSPPLQTPSLSPPSVDYDDVFGGPPRFVSSIFSSTAAPSDKPFPRVPSFRSSPTPVFELPVFGDGSFSNDTDKSSPFRPKSSPFGYEDIFNEDRQVLDVFPGLTSYESIVKSMPSSRQMSPLHPAAAKGLEKDGASMKPNAFLQPRSGSRNLIDGNSFPSSLSVEESTGSGSDSRDGNATGVPSSPLPEHSWDHLQKTIRSNSSDTGPRTNIQFDDVFGGFPQSRLFQQKTALGNNSGDVYRGDSENHSTKGVRLRDNVADVSAKMQSLPNNSFSPVDELGPHEDFIEIRMDRQNDYRGPGQQDVAETWVTVNDLRESSQLKFKSWKDWASDSPTSNFTNSVNNSDSLKLRAVEKDLREKDSRNGMTDPVIGTQGKLSRKNSGRSSLIQQYINKFSTEETEQTAEMEEKELQALLASAWKLNEDSQKKQNAIKRSSETSRGPEMKGHVKDRKNNHRLQSHKTMKDSENSEVSRSYLNQGNKDTLKSASFDSDTVNSDTAKLPFKNIEVKTPPVVRDTVIQENSSKTTSGVAPDTVANRYRSKESSKYDETSAVLQGGDDSGTVTNDHQDFVQYNEDPVISFIEEIEDIECFLELTSSLDGFQEIEGESLERRKSRLERHVRTKERAAKALEEMQQREAELHRQQEEKHQLSETADRKIKQWASGKEGNLRALLSNLQHVLWPDSGWTPIPLSSLIEGSDVKKAYRKATLFIHPDKLQQKSATLQQKYIAERVFDILQDAWKTFNTQELF